MADAVVSPAPPWRWPSESLNIDDPEKVKWRDYVFRARGRDLKGAVFDFADLSKVDFEGAQLQGASLEFAQLQGASLGHAQLQGASFFHAVLPDIRRAVVGAPSYFAENPPPTTPRELSAHRCISYRLAKAGGLYAWEFEENGRPLEVRVDGPLVFNDVDLMRQAAIAGLGIAYVYEDDAMDDIRAGRLTRILEDWCPPLPGYFLYHPT